MNQPADQKHQHGQLWQLYLAQDQPQVRSPELSDLDPNVLAAYLDGSADPDQIERIEARMAADPAFLEQIIQLRQLRDLAPATFSPSVLDRAKALAAAGPVRRTPSLSPFTWPLRLRWAAAAAAILLACLGGYSVGGLASRGQRQAEFLVASRTSMEMDELVSGPTFAMILPVNGPNGS